MRTLHNLVNRSFLFALFFTSLAVNSLVSQQELGTQLSSITILASANNDKLLLEPVAVATSNTPVCEGDTIFFTGDGAGMDGIYTWSGPNGFSSMEQNPFIANAQSSNAGVYQLIVEDSFGEKDTTTTLVIIRPDHLLMLVSDPDSENQMICDGSSVDTIIYQLVGGATSATVSGLPNGMDISISNDELKIFGNPVSGLMDVGTVSFTIDITSDGNVCTPDTASVDITIFKTIASASYSGPVCESGVIQLFSEGSAFGGTYAWSGPNAFSSSEQNPILSNVLFDQAGNYTVTVTDEAGCADSAEVEVIIYPNPTISAGLDTAFCLGGTTLLNATATGGVMPYSYVWDQGLGEGQSHLVMPSVATLYTVTVTDSLNCSTTDQIEIAVYENPIAFAGEDQGVCFGSTAEISASATGGNAPYTYSWNQGLGAGQTQNILPLDTITYVVTVTDSLACTSTDEVFIFINSLPAVITNPDIDICTGTSTNVSAFANGGTAPYMYTWDQGLGEGETHEVSPDSATIYTVTVTDLNGCTAMDQMTIGVNPNPTPSIGGNNIVCDGNFTLFDAGSGYQQYVWNTGENTQQITVDKEDIYIVTVTDFNGCIGTDSLSLIVNENPIANAGVDLAICFGDTTTLLGEASGDNTPFSFSWDQGLGVGQSFDVSPETTTIFTLTVMDTNSCIGLDEVIITVNDNPIANAGTDDSICLGDSTTIMASANGGLAPYNYTWDNGLGDGESFVIFPDTNSIYIVSVIDSNTCHATDTVVIIVNENPIVDAGLDTTICFGDSTIIMASANGGLAPYNYVWDNGLGIGESFNVSPDSATIFSVIATDSLGCIGEDEVQVNVNSNPVPVIIGDDSICDGDSTVLMVVQEYASYNWSTGDTTQQITVSLEDSYTVMVIDSNSCSAIDTFSLNLLENPTVDAGIDASICFGDSTIIMASANGGLAPYTFTWDNGLGDGVSFEVSPDTNTVYTVMVQDSNTCQSSDAILIVVNENPTADAGLDATICFGDTTTITASADGGLAPYNFMWDNDLGSGESFDISPDSTTIFSVIATDSLGCVGTDEVQINVNANPVPEIFGDESICGGDSTVLAVVQEYASYSWSTGDTTQQITVSLEDTYTVMVIDSNGCSALDTFSLNLLENPTAFAGIDASICFGDSTTIMASANGGLAPYSFSWDNGLGSGESFDVSPDTSTVYTLTVEDSLGCADTDEVFITVFSNPIPVISGDSSACQGDTVLFDAGSGYTDYLWSTGEITQTILTDTTGLYTVMVIDTNTCMGEYSVNLIVHENPDAVGSLDASVCLGDSTFIAAYATGGNPPYTFTWNHGLGEGQEFIVSPDSTTTYIVMVEDSVGCSAMDTIVIFVNELPVANAGLDASICFGDSTTILASANSGLAPYSFNWDNGLGSGESFDVNPDTSTIYTVTVTDSLGCMGADDVLITVNANPMVNITGLDAVCAGDNTDIDAGEGYVTYLWNTGDTTQLINVSEVGEYSVTVTDNNTCVGSGSLSFSLNENPEVDAGEDAAFCLGDTINISASASGGNGPFSYMWDNGLGIGESFDVSPDTSTTYVVEATDAFGCSAMDTLEITANALPTPEITGDFIICEGQSGILNAGEGYVSYFWNIGENTQQINVSEQGIYSVMVVDTNGCKANAFAAVNVTLTNQSIITGEYSLCGIDTTIINGGDNYVSYLWSTGDTTQLLSVSSPGIYSLTVTNEAGCPIYDEQIVVSLPGVFVDAGSDKSICFGDTTNLSASAEGGTGTLSYTWDQGLGEGQSHAVNPSTLTNYSVTVTDENGCEDTDEIVIDVNTLPEVSAGDDQEICAGDTVDLTAMITVGTGSFSYDWNQGLGDGQNHTIVPDVSQTYMVTVTDENGCKGSSAINVIVNPTPMIALEGSLVLCNGLSNTLDAGAGFETYTWSTGDTTQTISVSEAGNYTIEVTDENMCFASEEVEIIDGTILSTEISGSLEFCMGDFSELDAGVGFGSYIWNTGDTSQTIIVTDAGEYTVTVSSPNSCDAEAEAIVIVNENPLVFAGEDVQICEGDSLDLFAEAVGGIAPYSYVWNEGLGEGQMHTISPETSTDYIVVAADVNQCLSEDTISINVSPAINVELSADSSLVITGGVMPFDTVYSIDGDSLSVLITDAFGCTAEDQVFVTGVEEIAIQLIDRIFPSPANEILYIEYYKNSYQDIQMKLIDINGRTAFSSYELLSQIHLTSFKSGTYILQIITKEGVQSVPVVIMH